MCGFGNDSCFQTQASCDHDLVDVSKQIHACDPFQDELDQLFQLIPDSIWGEIDDIINSVDVQPSPTKQQSRKLVRKREDRGVCVGIQLNYSYGLEQRKRPKMDDIEFLKPKTYECAYCPVDMLNVHVYLRHLRRHREAELRHRMSRCNSCGSLFNDIIQTKWHQTQCLKRSIVSNL